MRDVTPGERGQRRHALERLAGPFAVHRLEVVEAPGAVEAELLGELHPAHQLVPRHPLLRHIESESHRRNLRDPRHGRPPARSGPGTIARPSHVPKSSMAAATAALRMDAERSNACWPPGSSAWITGARDVARRRSANSRA